MKLLLIFLIAALPSAIFAQSNYHPGYILKNNGDTLKGNIDYREWSRSPRFINFKINKGDKEILQFYPGMIKEFQITGMETYVSYIGAISMNKTNFNELPTRLDTTEKIDSVFIKQAVTGKYLTLYYQNDEFKTRFFIAEVNGKPVELKYYEYIDNLMRDVSTNVYKGQLLVYINKYATENKNLINAVTQMQFGQAYLEAVVDKINNNGKVIKRKSAARFFAGLGISNISTQVNDANYDDKLKTSTIVSPQINAGFDIFDNSNVQSLIFRVEASFSYVTPREKYPVTIGGAQTYEVYEFNQYTGSVTPQIIINVYNKDNLKVFIGGGLALNFSVYTNDQITLISSDQRDVEANTIKQPYHLEPFWSNFPLETGITLNKKIELSFTYIGYTNYTKYATFYARNQTMDLGVKYLFGK